MQIYIYMFGCSLLCTQLLKLRLFVKETVVRTYSCESKAQPQHGEKKLPLNRFDFSFLQTVSACVLGQKCYKLLRCLQCHVNSYPFRKPISEEEVCYPTTNSSQ